MWLSRPAEIRQEPQRRRVGPVRIVDEQRERPVAGEVCRHAVQPVQDGERSLRPERQGGGLREWDVEQRRRMARRALEGRRGVAVVDRGLEQLPHDPEPERALELGPASRERRQPRLARACARRGDQCGLADPRRTLHDHRAPRTRRHGFDGRTDHAKLNAPLHQLAQLAVRHRPAPWDPAVRATLQRPRCSSAKEAQLRDDAVATTARFAS